MSTAFVAMHRYVSDRQCARVTNLNALCRALDARAISGPERQAAAFGPSMTADRLCSLLAGAPCPDFLARSIEHIMGVPIFWLDEPHQEVSCAAGRLLVDQALRGERPEASSLSTPELTGLSVPANG